jgi:hypothetical protein
MDTPTTGEVGRPFGCLRGFAELAEAGGRRREANDFLRGAGPFVVVDGAGSGLSSTVPGEDPLLVIGPEIEIDVLVDRGEPCTGVSGAVEHAGVVAVVADDEGREDAGKWLGSGDGGSEGVEHSGSGDGGVAKSSLAQVISENGTMGSLRGFGDGLGEGGGVVVDSAPSMISGGGRDRGENITPGALVASRGGRDQITQPPRSGFVRRGEGVEVVALDPISSS